MVVPNDYQIQVVREQRFMAKITERLEHANLPAYQRIIETYLAANPEVAPAAVATVLALLLNQDKPWQTSIAPAKSSRPAKEAHVRSPGGSSSRPVRESGGLRLSDRAASGDTQRSFSTDYVQELFRIEVGRVHGVKPGNIVGAIANEAGLQSKFITGLKIHDDHSTVRLPKDMDKNVVQALNKAWVCGRQLNLTSLDVA